MKASAKARWREDRREDFSELNSSRIPSRHRGFALAFVRFFFTR